MRIQNKFDNNILKTAILTLILALICVFVPLAITSHAETAVISQKIELSRSKYSFAEGKTVQMSASVKPDNTTNKGLKYSSSDESVCTVDENGLLTGVSFGKAEITVSAADGGAASVVCEVNVLHAIDESNTQIKMDSDTYTFTGSYIRPRVQIYFGETLLVQDEDYEIVYSDNLNAGEASIKIYGIGDYFGELEKSFIIKQADINDVTFGSIANQTFSGTAIKPDIEASLGSYKLEKEVDYSLSYENNINKGTAEVIITAKGNFQGQVRISFTISAANINLDVTIPSVSKVTYTGGELTPSVKPSIGGYNLVLNKDYTVSYSNNINIGSASIIIKGIGNVTGTKTVKFKIVPCANKLISYSGSLKTSLKLKWKKKSGITGYKIYIYDSSKKDYIRKKTILSANTTSCTIKGLKAGGTYYFKIASFCRIDGVDYISYLSSGALAAMTVPADSKVIQAIGENHSATIRWKKISGANGYIIYRYNKTKKKYVRIAKVKGNTKFTYKDKNLKKSKTYKYKVKAYKTLKGKTLKGKVSSKKSVLTISFRWPVPGFYYISQTYNNKSSMYASGSHSGTDIASNGKSILGAKIIATKGGIVDSVNKSCKHNYGKTKSCGCGGGFGNYVVVRSTFKINGKKVILRVIYGHMSSVKVKVGQYVSSGQLLGTVGSTGYSTGPHLHFEFRLQDSPSSKIKKRLNPLNYVKKK